jgi:hypothetical protein
MSEQEIEALIAEEVASYKERYDPAWRVEYGSLYPGDERKGVLVMTTPEQFEAERRHIYTKLLPAIGKFITSCIGKPEHFKPSNNNEQA